MIDIFTRVTTLKESAKANRDFGDYESALEDLNQAVEAIKKEDTSTQEANYKDRLRHELADCYGMMGGNYRRLADVNESDIKLFKLFLEKALDSYKKGLEFEEDNSYNLSNLIIIEILLDPMQLIYQRLKIIECLATIKKQIMGERRDQWWAWADLGLFKLLVGDNKGALEAYSQFKQKGARDIEYESAINVLSDLQKRLQNADLPQAISTAQSIGEVIQLLKKDTISNIVY